MPPIVDRKELSPDDAHAAGRCPECGEQLEGLNIEAHIATHWPHLEKDNPQHAEAIRRANLLRDFAKGQQAKSADQKGA
jgi:hypothetical protein